MSKTTRVALLGCGTIGGYVLEAIVSGQVPDTEVAVASVRSMSSKGVDRLQELNIPIVTAPAEVLNYQVDVVAENASHQAVEQYGSLFLENGISLIPMSLGALVDNTLLQRLITSAKKGHAQLIIPSGGIGGLDALQAAMVPGLDSVTMVSRKPPRAWKKIPYVEEVGWDLDHMTEATLLFDGPAADCVKKFPQNINIAAALSLATIGFDRTRIQIYADPGVTLNTHQIIAQGPNGKLSFLFENTPVEANPKTTYQACTSVVATLRRYSSGYRIGT